MILDNRKTGWFDSLPIVNEHEHICPCGEKIYAESLVNLYAPRRDDNTNWIEGFIRWISEHYEHRNRKTENQSSDATLNIELEAENNIALKLRFVSLGEAVVMQVLSSDFHALGWLPEKSDKYEGERSFIQTSLIAEMLLATALPIIPQQTLYKDGRGNEIYTPIPFEEVKTELTKFVEDNCFHGGEKPVPRIEQVMGKYNVIDNNGGIAFELSGGELSLFERIIGQSILVYNAYKDKPQFTSEWKKIYPQTFHFTDFALPEDMESRFFNLSIEEGKTAAELMNRRNSDTDIEIWEFTVWSK